MIASQIIVSFWFKLSSERGTDSTSIARSSYIAACFSVPSQGFDRILLQRPLMVVGKKTYLSFYATCTTLNYVQDDCP
jgi:hypothetical protein